MMKYTVERTRAYRKAFKRYSRSGRFNVKNLEKVINTLASGEKLHEHYHDHKLRGGLEGLRECHVEGDLLLIYTIEDSVLVLTLLNLGSHSDLFGL